MFGLKVQHNNDDFPLPNVLMYVDNSNIFESARIYSARYVKGFKAGIVDVPCRVMTKKLMAIVKGKRNLLIKPKIYGSKNLAMEAVWDKSQMDVQTFRKSEVTGKEKEVDTSLVADAVEDIINMRDDVGDDCTVIIISGDADLIPVVKKAKRYGYKVELWAFRFSISNSRMEREKSDRVEIKYIDEIFDQVAYAEYEWDKNRPIQPDRALVATVNVRLPTDMDKKEFLKDCVAKAGELFKVPMLGMWMHNNNENIALIPCHKEFYIPRRSNIFGIQNICVYCSANKRLYSFDTDIFPNVYKLKEAFPGICTDITTWMEFRTRAAPDDTPNFVSDNRFSKLELEFRENINKVENNCQDEFVPVYRKETKRKEKKPIKTGSCKDSFWCSEGNECPFVWDEHTSQERQVFRKIPDFINNRRFYKTKPCKYEEACGFNDENRTHLCPGAHSLEERHCAFCSTNGAHWMSQCPAKRPTV